MGPVEWKCLSFLMLSLSFWSVKGRLTDCHLNWETIGQWMFGLPAALPLGLGYPFLGYPLVLAPSRSH